MNMTVNIRSVRRCSYGDSDFGHAWRRSRSDPRVALRRMLKRREEQTWRRALVRGEM